MSIMKKYYKSLGLIAIMLFSFYYTEKIAILMQNKSPIMQSINEIADDYAISAINASIDGDYITPGISGRIINRTKSYVNMKSFGIFNAYYLIFDEIKPKISIHDNKDKIIKKGHASKNAISFLIEDNNKIQKYMEQNKISGSILIKETEYEKNSFLEQINNDQEKYSNVESLLNKNSQNKNICYIKSMNQEMCKKNQKYLIEETFYLNAQNIVEAKNKIESGAIILIKPTASLEEFKLLVKEIRFKGLNILPLSELIDEKIDD